MCAHACMCACVHACIFVIVVKIINLKLSHTHSGCVRTHACVRVCVHVCIHILSHIHTYICATHVIIYYLYTTIMIESDTQQVSGVNTGS